MTDLKKPTNLHIVIVEDEIAIGDALEAFFVRKGYRVSVFRSAEKVYEIFEQKNAGSFDIILSDISLPGIDGLELIQKLNDLKMELPPMIMMTAFGGIESAVTAIKLGAFDYLSKPFQMDDLQIKVERAIQFRRLKEDHNILQRQIKKSWELKDMIGKSQKMQNVFDLIQRVSKVECNVLILGESGTGKELVASAIHSTSRRATGPFIAINCAAIPEALLESELFGHAKGAFTGATTDKKGLILEAHGGVLFLDEIGDMSISLQAKLLRFLQERKIKPVGQNQYRSVDVRVVAATHRNLAKSIAAGTFREDLFYRLNVVHIDLPPLRDRKEDIPLLVSHFLDKFRASNGIQITGFTQKALEKLIQCSWEGNVRQLANIIEQAVVLSDQQTIDEHHILTSESSSRVELESPEKTVPIQKEVLSFVEMEKIGMVSAMNKVHGNKERAAELLGISRKTFYRKEKEYGLVKNDQLSF